jgi:Outer membrane lipoprotein-sorting protein
MLKHNLFFNAVAALLFCISGFGTRAQDVSPTGPDAGRELAAMLRSLSPTEAVKWSGVLKIAGRDQKMPPVPIQCETKPGETNWSVTYWTAGTKTMGAEKLTIVFSTDGPNQYIYAQAAVPDAELGKPRILSGAEADIPLAGSDFWLSDLGFEFYHWPNQVRQPGQMRRSRPCNVLESSNPHPAPGGYSLVRTWVEKESNQPLQAEACGADQKVMKEFELGSVTKINGHYEVKDLKMFNRKTGSRTYLDFDLSEAKK